MKRTMIALFAAFALMTYAGAASANCGQCAGDKAEGAAHEHGADHKHHAHAATECSDCAEGSKADCKAADCKNCDDECSKAKSE